jgi:Na+/proline symporter/signal transduction histidine kinase/CheY-like chemotaxis protein
MGYSDRVRVLPTYSHHNKGFAVSPSIVLIVVFSYILLLFGLARFGDKKYFIDGSWVRHPIVYALALGVYCTSWTFYGLVGTASVKGWNFFPILLGPILLFTLGFPLLERIYTICRQEHIHSIADFLASRYGKRQGVAATISLVVLIATVPYIALQLKAVSDTLLLTIGPDFLVSQDLTLVIGLSMIAFTMLFGAKRLDMSGYHSGLMSAIAFESILKLIVLMCVALFSLFWMSDTSISDVASQSLADSTPEPSVFYQPITWPRFLIETLLSVCAIFCLPRMFHVTFVECISKKHLQYSRWVFVAYLMLISVFIVIIASAGNDEFLNNDNVSGDAYVIALPLAKGVDWLAVFAFLGGFSAATAMIIVATITLSHMLSNDVILPLLIRRQKQKSTPHDFSRSLIFARRLTVLLVILGAYFYQSLLAENVALTSIGLIAFALIVQLAPGVLFGLYWRKGNANGLYAGLIVGLSLWFYTLMIPLLSNAGLINDYVLREGLFGIAWLRPEYLLNLSFSDAFTRSVILSLGANIIFYCWYSVTSLETLVDRIQSAAFTNQEKGAYDYYEGINLNDLEVLLNEFLGETAANNILSTYDPKGDKTAKHRLIEKAQKALASIVGVASSQSMIETLYSGKKMAVEEVVNLFGNTTKALRFNQEVLSASFENISSGISVVDSNLCLIAWNQHYEDMFDYPADMLYVGFHVADIMRFNADRGLLGTGDAEGLIAKRLSYMTAGRAYRVIRYHQDDTVIEIKGQPLPNGGYVTTYDDITEFIRVQKNLEDANANLEQRVQERTRTIEEVNTDLLKEIRRRGDIEQELREAKTVADDANASKTKFLALASHDIMQPLNAASLYASALSDSREDDGGLHQDENIVRQLRSAIQNTESIIATLLEVSKLDSGVIQPKRTDFYLDNMLSNIIDEVGVQLPKEISIRYCKTSAFVNSDQHYLHRIVQNFVSNAVKYTTEGTVLVGCRRVRSDEGQVGIEICVVDNGIGISEYERASIFDDFYRVPANARGSVSQQVIPGVGLGLSVVSRFSELLSHQVRCRSELGKGSCFSVVVPLSVKAPVKTSIAENPLVEQSGLQDLMVAYVDDEQQNLLATSALLDRWQCNMIALDTIAAARDYAHQSHVNTRCIPDVLLMDYQLDEASISGLVLAQELLAVWQARLGPDARPIPVCIISAAAEVDLPERAMALGFQFLRKPVKPGRLRALLTQFKGRRDLPRV